MFLCIDYIKGNQHLRTKGGPTSVPNFIMYINFIHSSANKKIKIDTYYQFVNCVNIVHTVNILKPCDHKLSENAIDSVHIVCLFTRELQSYDCSSRYTTCIFLPKFVLLLNKKSHLNWIHRRRKCSNFSCTQSLNF